MGEAMATARETAAALGLAGRAADVWLAMLATAALASPGHLDAACDAALELRLNRPVTREDETDPLGDLEATLMEEGAFTPWGATAYPDEEDDPDVLPDEERPTGIGEEEETLWSRS
jgi:hypothetical protein